jgi:hypothetical protein
MSSEQLHARAERGFKKPQRSSLARARPMAEYVADTERRQLQSSKLKALRLAKEAADLAAATPLPPAKRAARKPAAKP